MKLGLFAWSRGGLAYDDYEAETWGFTLRLGPFVFGAEVGRIDREFPDDPPQEQVP